MKKTLADIYNYIENFIPKSDKDIERDAENFWNNTNNNVQFEDLSHHKGHGRWANLDEWNKIGVDHLDIFNRFCQYIQYTKPIKYILEWGTGGGANAIHFSKGIEKYYGVDISEISLNECSKQMKFLNIKTFIPVKIEIDKPEKCVLDLDQKMDLFLCTAVYQHFPNKDYGIRITKLASESLSNSGAALIQIRYDNHKVKFKPKFRNYKRNLLSFTSYGIDEFCSILENSGLKPICITLNPKINYAYYFAIKNDI